MPKPERPPGWDKGDKDGWGDGDKPPGQEEEMAISIDSTTNMTIIDAAEATTGWTFSGITKTAVSTASREGTNCVGGQVALNSFGYGYHTHGSSVNMTTAGNDGSYR